MASRRGKEGWSEFVVLCGTRRARNIGNFGLSWGWSGGSVWGGGSPSLIAPETLLYQLVCHICPKAKV